jgi:hypothetical protein
MPRSPTPASIPASQSATVTQRCTVVEQAGRYAVDVVALQSGLDTVLRLHSDFDPGLPSCPTVGLSRLSSLSPLVIGFVA